MIHDGNIPSVQCEMSLRWSKSPPPQRGKRHVKHNDSHMYSKCSHFYYARYEHCFAVLTEILGVAHTALRVSKNSNVQIPSSGKVNH
jgi:hypothetical protein